MIIIKEDTPKKLSGKTSFFLSFDYNEDINDIIKNCIAYYYHKKLKCWEVSILDLSYILDSLTYFDDIKLVLKADEELPETSEKPVLSYKIKPFPHQLEAIEYGLQENHKKWLLLDSAGLGKSFSMISLAEELRAQKGIKHCLIICGIATLRANWEKEIRKYSDLSYITIGKKINSKGNISWKTLKERAEQLVNPIDEFFVIINVESLVDDTIIEAINNSDNSFDMIVFDEVHKAKGSRSERGKNLLKINVGEYRIGLSGTLIMNNPLDVFVPLHFIGVEHSTLSNFKKTYCKFGGFGGYEIIGFKNLDLLKDELESYSLRRTKDLIDLPPKTVIDEFVEMSDAHRKFYENVKNGVKEECDKIELKPNNVLAITTRLRQATSCPSLLTTNNIISSKVERCVELVDDIIAQGDKVVIMSTFKEPVYQLQKLLEKYNPLIGTGDMKDSEVSDNIDKFQTLDKHKVFIGTSSKVGTGVTLNAATYLIAIDQAWTAALQEQVEDRIHRINNTKPVFIYNLICENTIDETVSEIISRKKAISDFIVDDKLDADALEILKRYIEEL